jgi:DNA-binding transcriptional ArsR family regulator
LSVGASAVLPVGRCDRVGGVSKFVYRSARCRTIRGCRVLPIHGASMIDESRKQIQARLDQLMAEANKLRRALAALGGGDRSAPADSAPRRMRARRSTESPSRSAARAGSSSRGSSATASDATRGRSTGQRSRTRAAQGETRSAVLAALSSGEAMTAGEVAAATGLGRASVSTTLSKLAKSGEVAKADRGYRRAESSRAAQLRPVLRPNRAAPFRRSRRHCWITRLMQQSGRSRRGCCSCACYGGVHG